MTPLSQQASPKRIRGFRIHVERQTDYWTWSLPRISQPQARSLICRQTIRRRWDHGGGRDAEHKDALRLENLRIIYQMTPGSFGGRILMTSAEAEDGSLYITIGDRGDRGKRRSDAVDYFSTKFQGMRSSIQLVLWSWTRSRKGEPSLRLTCVHAGGIDQGVGYAHDCRRPVIRRTGSFCARHPRGGFIFTDLVVDLEVFIER